MFNLRSRPASGFLILEVTLHTNKERVASYLVSAGFPPAQLGAEVEWAPNADFPSCLKVAMAKKQQAKPQPKRLFQVTTLRRA